MGTKTILMGRAANDCLQILIVHFAYHDLSGSFLLVNLYSNRFDSAILVNTAYDLLSRCNSETNNLYPGRNGAFRIWG